MIRIVHNVLSNVFTAAKESQNTCMKKNKKMGGGMMQDSMGYKKGGAVRGGRKEIKGLRPAKMF